MALCDIVFCADIIYICVIYIFDGSRDYLEKIRDGEKVR